MTLQCLEMLITELKNRNHSVCLLLQNKREVVICTDVTQPLTSF